jgi:chromosome segregation ATPase
LILRLKKTVSRLKNHVKVLQRARSGSDDDEKLEQLEGECQKLRLQVQSLTNDLETAREGNSIDSTTKLKLETAVSELENALRSKTGEIERLNEIISDYVKLREDERNANAQIVRKHEKNVIQNRQLIQQRIHDLEAEIERQRKRFHLDIKKLRQQNEVKALELAGTYEEAKQRFEAVITGLQQKMKGMAERSAVLSQSLAESESRNQQLKDEIAQLRILQRSLELKNTTLQETLQKERLIVQNQLSASKLLLTSELQTMNESMREQINAQKTQIFSVLLSKMRI